MAGGGEGSTGLRPERVRQRAKGPAALPPEYCHVQAPAAITDYLTDLAALVVHLQPARPPLGETERERPGRSVVARDGSGLV
jgi:hypothetical protein